MSSLSETRRAFLATLGAAIPVLAAKKTPPATPPNIILVLADELPAAAFGCYGNRQQNTPNVDALARRGVRFTNALASSRGGAVGRSVLLSGRMPMQAASGSDILITDLLAGKNYDSAFVGAWGLGNDQQPGHGIHSSYTLAASQMYSNGEPATDAGSDPAAILARRAGQFLDQQKPASKPFFLAVSNPPSLSAAAVDAQLGAVVKKIGERGLDDNTLIVFTSAGGTPEDLHTPLMFCWPGHAPVEATRPDMIGSYDLMPTLCAACDIPPPDRNLCGRSYLPLVEGKPFPKKNPWRTIVYGSFTDASGTADAASDNRFQLVVRNGGKGPNNQLFDLRADPTRVPPNQYANRAFVTTRDSLRRNLNQWKAKYSV